MLHDVVLGDLRRMVALLLTLAFGRTRGCRDGSAFDLVGDPGLEIVRKERGVDGADA
jgi:hypothetical protein